MKPSALPLKSQRRFNRGLLAPLAEAGRFCVVCVDRFCRLWHVLPHMSKKPCPVFGARLAAVLARRGMKQTDLAKMCAVSPRAVRNWMSGIHPSPTVGALLTEKWGEGTWYYIIGATDRMPEPQPEPVRLVEV